MLYFINEGDVKELSSISTNVDSHLVVPHIHISEVKHIKYFLGVAFYEDLKTKLNANTLIDIEKEFINNYLKIVHVHYALYQAFPFLFVKIDNKGIVMKTANGDVVVSESYISMLRAEIEDNAQFFKSEADKYLAKNKVDFPLYKPDCAKSEIYDDIIAVDERKFVFSERKKWSDDY